jgi:hypothetical protein
MSTTHHPCCVVADYQVLISMDIGADLAELRFEIAGASVSAEALH